MSAYDIVMEGVIKRYETNVEKMPLYYLMCSLKTFTHHFEHWLVSKSKGAYDLSFRRDWLREAFMSCIELGIAATPENMLRLLEDKPYFESLLPIPIVSPEWGGASGTEIIRQWWLLASEEYRRCHLDAFRVFLNSCDMSSLRRSLVVHTGSGNRGFVDAKSLTYPYEKSR